MAEARFFKNTQRSGISPISVRDDDIFRVLAITIIDNEKSGRPLPDTSAQKILERMALYFPNAKKTQASLSQHESLDYLAFVLRQLAVDEALSNPATYKELFENLSGELANLRQQNTPLHHCALAAVARALNITITCSIKAFEKELRARDVLNNEQCTSTYNVTIQIQGNRYFPCVRDDHFAAVGQLPTKMLAPVLPMSAETLSEVHDEIASSDQAMWDKYLEYCTRLFSTADANGFNFHALVELYSKSEFLPDESSLRLLSQLEKKYPQTIVLNGPVKKVEQQNFEKLIKALASALCTGRIKEDQLFDAMEERSSHLRTVSAAG